MYAAASLTNSSADAMAIPWLGHEPYGTLANADGVVIRILTLGAVIASVEAQDRDGVLRCSEREWLF